MSFYSSVRWLYRALDAKVFSRLAPSTQLALKRRLLAAGRKMYPSRIIEGDARKLVKEGGSFSPSWVPPALPEWVRAEMASIAEEIDPALDPAGANGQALEFYGIPTQYDLPGRVYFRLRKAAASSADVVIFVPWLKRGGADLGAIYFAQALHAEFKRRVLVIGTEQADSPWAGRLPEGVQFLDAGTILAELTSAEKIAVMARLLVQMRPSVVHVMNSMLAWQVVLKHGLAVRQASRIFASLYCDDRSPDGYRVGYAQSFLQDCYPNLDGVITDNTRTMEEWITQMGVPRELFHVVGFPARVPKLRSVAPPVERNRLLWAGRFDRQKRPDLIPALAKALPEFQFDVYGGGVVAGQSVDMGALRSAPNVKLHGVFEDLFDIIVPEHLALVYTSSWDGLPTVLLDAAAMGLPSIAPDVGGVSDFVRPDMLVDSVENIEQYAEKLRALAGSPENWQRHSEQVASLARQERNWQAFVDGVRAVPGYVNSAESQRD